MLRCSLQARIINILVFQIAWAVCIFLSEQLLVVLAVTIATMMVHVFNLIYCLKVSPSALFAHIKLLLVTIFMGVAIDISWGWLNILNYANGSLIPVWLICLWCCFATTVVIGLGWLSQRMWLAAAFGFFFAPVSYYLGANATNVVLTDPFWFSLVSIGIVWSFLLPLLLTLAFRWSLTDERSQPPT